MDKRMIWRERVALCAAALYALALMPVLRCYVRDGLYFEWFYLRLSARIRSAMTVFVVFLDELGCGLPDPVEDGSDTESPPSIADRIVDATEMPTQCVMVYVFTFALCLACRSFLRLFTLARVTEYVVFITLLLDGLGCEVDSFQMITRVADGGDAAMSITAFLLSGAILFRGLRFFSLSVAFLSVSILA